MDSTETSENQSHGVVVRMFIAALPAELIPPGISVPFPSDNTIGTMLLSRLLASDLKRNGVSVKPSNGACGPLNSAIILFMVDDPPAALRSLAETLEAVNLLASASLYWYCAEELFFRGYHICANDDTPKMFTIEDVQKIADQAAEAHAPNLAFTETLLARLKQQSMSSDPGNPS